MINEGKTWYGDIITHRQMEFEHDDDDNDDDDDDDDDDDF
jgi:hypothetical protein